MDNSLKKEVQIQDTACWSQINSKKKLHPKFLQNLFFHTSIYVIQGKNFCSAIESATQNFFWSLQKWLVFHQFDPFKGILRPWYGFKSTWRPQKVSIVMFLSLHCQKIYKIKKKFQTESMPLKISWNGSKSSHFCQFFNFKKNFV